MRPQVPKIGRGYSPAKFFRIFSAVPVGISPACLGTLSDFPVAGLVHLSCRFPCWAKKHPAFLKAFSNSDIFMI